MASKEFRFTNAWFEYQRPVHERYLTALAEKGPVKLLEIGSHEGRSTTYFLTKLTDPGSSVHCIDPFDDGDSISPVSNQTYLNFVHNVGQTGKTVTLMREFSHTALSALILKQEQFDYVLIDGSHLNKDVMLDACLVYHLAKPGGIIFFDDYKWGNNDPPEGPPLGIKNWLEAYQGYVEVLYTAYHLVVKKK